MKKVTTERKEEEEEEDGGEKEEEKEEEEEAEEEEVNREKKPQQREKKKRKKKKEEEEEEEGRRRRRRIKLPLSSHYFQQSRCNVTCVLHHDLPCLALVAPREGRDPVQHLGTQLLLRLVEEHRHGHTHFTIFQKSPREFKVETFKSVCSSKAFFLVKQH